MPSKGKRKLFSNDIVGAPEEKITGAKLPSNEQVLRVYRYHSTVLKQTVNESAHAVADQVLAYWNRARIPTVTKPIVAKRIKKLNNSLVCLAKSQKRHGGQTKKEDDFKNNLADLFDVATADALVTIKNTEDRAFLQAQREKGRRGCMVGPDIVLAVKEARIEETAKKEQERKEREEERRHLEQAQSREAMEFVESEFAAMDEEDSSKHDSDDDAEFVVQPGPSRAPKRDVMTPRLAAVLDRLNISDRKGAMLIAEISRSLGHDLDDLVLSRNSIRSARSRMRADMAYDIAVQFDPSGGLVVHWDGKLLPDLTGHKKVDRLPVLVSGLEGYKLLGIPKLDEGTGKAQAAAVLSELKKWDLVHSIIAMCFDTTASNTGSEKGACTLLAASLRDDILHLACRHHVFEGILGNVFEKCMGPSKSPDIALFKRFRDAWDGIKDKKFEPGVSDPEILAAVSDVQDSVTDFAVDQLKKHQPRDDYREALELAIIFLGGVPPRGVRFMSPGAVCSARWMVVMLYAPKIWMFRSHFHLTRFEERGLRNVCIFLVRFYLKAWFLAPSPVSAPHADLRLLQALVYYKETNKTVADAALDKLQRHLWYISEMTVGLLLFDNQVSVDCKTKMVRALTDREGTLSPSPRIPLDKRSLHRYLGLVIDSFVTKRTSGFFNLLSIDTGFLESDPETWPERGDYQEGLEKARHLRVVNDNAERGVKLAQEFNKCLTKDEDQRQYLLQVVERHRKMYPDFRKPTLAK